MDYELFIKNCDEHVSGVDVAQIESKDGYVKIIKLAGNNIYIMREKLTHLIKKIIYEHIVNNKPLYPYLTYARVLLDGTRDNTVRKEDGDSNEINWIGVIGVLGEIKSTCLLMEGDQQDEFIYTSHFNFSRSCANLIKKGYKIIEKDDAFFIDSQYDEAITHELDRLAISVGGCNILYAVFNSISSTYDEDQKRFHVVRNLSIGIDMPKQQIPWAHLIALGVKHSNEMGDDFREENFVTLVELLKDLITTFELQDYSPYESWYIDPHGLIPFLTDEILYDNFYCIPQSSEQYAVELLRFIISSDEFKGIQSHSYTIQKIFSSGLAILNKTDDKQITDLSILEIHGILKISKAKAILLVNTILANISPNRDLGFPPKSTKTDHSFNQLIPFNSGYLLLPRSLSSLAFINTTLNAIIAPDGKRNDNNDATLGTVIERFVKHKLDIHDIEYRSGEFISKYGTISGECDIVIETEDAIIFIEIKKKGMTRLSMSGVDYSILSDLGSGLIHATAQCFKAERILKCDDELLINGSAPLKYKSQRIFKIALTLNDYGSFQDRMTIRTILANSLNMTFEGRDKKINKKLEDWKEHLSEISEHIGKLKEVGKLPREPFHDLFFMSIPQLTLILEKMQSSAGVVSALRTLASLSYSTRDFYKEFSLSKLHFKK